MIFFIMSGIIFTVFFIVVSSIYAAEKLAEKLSDKYDWDYTVVVCSFIFVEFSIVLFILGILETLKIIQL